MTNLGSVTRGPSSSDQLIALQRKLMDSGCSSDTAISRKVNDISLYILTDKNKTESLEVEVRGGASFKHSAEVTENSDIHAVATKILNLYKTLPKDQQKNFEVLKENLYKIIESSIETYTKELRTDSPPELKHKIEDLEKIQKEFHSIQQEEHLIDELKKTLDTDSEKINRLLNQMSYPIHGAILSGKATKEVMDRLIAEGADPNAKDEKGNTPLHSAYKDGNNKVLFHLIEKDGVDLNATDSSGMTLLHHACKDGRSDVIATLVATGKCDPNARDTNNSTPTEYLLKYGNEETLKALQQEFQQILQQEFQQIETSQKTTDFKRIGQLEQLTGHFEQLIEQLRSAIETRKSTPAQPKDITTTPKETFKAPPQSANYQNWHKSTKSSIDFSTQELFRSLLTTKTTNPETMIKTLGEFRKHGLYPKDAKFLASTLENIKSKQVPDVFKQLPFLAQLHVRECMTNLIAQKDFEKQLKQNAETLQIEELDAALEYLNNSLDSTRQTTILPKQIQEFHKSLQATLTKIKEKQTLTESHVEKSAQSAQEKRKESSTEPKRDLSQQQKTIGHANKLATTHTRTPLPTARQSRLTAPPSSQTTTPLTPITRASSPLPHSGQSVKAPIQKRELSPAQRTPRPIESKRTAPTTKTPSPTTEQLRLTTPSPSQSPRTTESTEKMVSAKKSLVSTEVSNNYQTWNQKSDDNFVGEEMLETAYNTDLGRNTIEILELSSLSELCPADAERVAKFLEKHDPTVNSFKVFDSFSPLDRIHIIESMSNKEKQKIYKKHLITTLRISKTDLLILSDYLKNTINNAKNPNINPIPILKDIYNELNLARR